MGDVAHMAGACTISPAAASVNHSMTSLPWFALRIREKLRSTTEQYLVAGEHEFFSPVTTELRQWSDRRKKVSVPVFGGYLFCRFEREQQLAVLRTPGVIDIVRCGARPAEVDAQELAAIRTALVTIEKADPLPHLVCGQRVQVVQGPMAGVEGVLAMVRSELRLVLAVTMMNRSVAVEIDRANVIAIF
jgi:transcription antitermination factor NusG